MLHDMSHSNTHTMRKSRLRSVPRILHRGAAASPSRADLARSQILKAATNLLKKRPFSEVSVDQIMAETSLSRPAFYVYFKNVYELVEKLVENVSKEISTLISAWLSRDGDTVRDLRTIIDGVVEACMEYGYIARTLFEASTRDTRAERTHRRLMEQTIDAVEKKIKMGIADGMITPMNTHEMARALCLMTERYLIETVSRDKRSEKSIVGETLLTIWARTLYLKTGSPSSK